jgi:UDP-N-acetylglucosamine 2-epimerase (non-hydrolysing)
MTLHRPSNVDDKDKLRDLLNEIINASHGQPLVFPVHPRTAKMLEQIGLDAPNLNITGPQGYLEFNYLVKHARAVITDSGGITEETTVMGIPCMTLRNSTERPETCTVGTNELLGTDPKSIAPALKRLFDGEWKKGAIPELWDGHTAGRIISHIETIFKLN